MWLTIAYIVMLAIISYSIIVFCNIEIFKYMTHHRHSLSEAAKGVQAELNRVLLAQTIIPTFTFFLPVTIHLIGMVSNLDLAFTSFLFGIFYSWIPTGNALSTLIFVTAYKRKLKQLFVCVREQLPRFGVTNIVTSNERRL